MLQFRVETYKSEESLKWIIPKPEHHFKRLSKKAHSSDHSPDICHLQMVLLSQEKEPLGTDLKGCSCWLMLLHRSWSQKLKFKLLDIAFKTFHDLASNALSSFIFQHNSPCFTGYSHTGPLIVIGNLSATLNLESFLICTIRALERSSPKYHALPSPSLLLRDRGAPDPEEAVH